MRKMRKIVSRIFGLLLLGLVGGLNLGSVQASERLTVKDFLWERSVFFPAISQSVPIRLYLDTDILQKLNPDLSDLFIFSRDNTELSFQILREKAGKIEFSRGVEVSSQKSGAPENLLDDNGLTTFAFDAVVDRGQGSWMLFDLGRSRRISRVEIIPDAVGKIQKLEIVGGNNLERMAPLVSRRSFSRTQYYLPNESVRYIKILLWGPKLAVGDIRMHYPEETYLFFTPKSGEQYYLFYGNPSLLRNRFPKVVSTSPDTFLRGSLKREKLNPLFPEDFDQDEVPNDRDNCIFFANKNQTDRDGDQHGDVCDNAPYVRNVTQQDRDLDGVGDVADNCPAMANMDQEDRDEDGVGDLCDQETLDKVIRGVGQESITKFSPVTWGILGGIGVLFLGAGTFWLVVLRRR
jgi:hypothetical protein